MRARGQRVAEHARQGPRVARPRQRRLFPYGLGAPGMAVAGPREDQPDAAGAGP
ncbi:hypothetical protein ACWGMA_14285 [Streptomyces asiaticus]